MNELRVRLTANRYRLTFPHARSVLAALLPDLQAPEPDWLALARTLETAEPGGTVPAGFTWRRQAALRPDDRTISQHLAHVQAFAALHPAWLLQLPLTGNPDGLGLHQHGLILLAAAEVLRLLPHLLTESAPAIWARGWPDLHEAAIDVDRLDPCHDGQAGQILNDQRVRFHQVIGADRKRRRHPRASTSDARSPSLVVRDRARGGSFFRQSRCHLDGMRSGLVCRKVKATHLARSGLLFRRAKGWSTREWPPSDLQPLCHCCAPATQPGLPLPLRRRAPCPMPPRPPRPWRPTR